MPNIASVLKAEISRISRKESRIEVEKLRAMVAQQRKDLAALKQQAASLAKSVARLQRGNLSKAHSIPLSSSAGTSPEGLSVTGGVKFSPAKLIRHRTLLGISANDYGVLVGASGQSVYKWETGKAQPRAKQLDRLSVVMAMGKRQFVAAKATSQG